MRYMPHLVLMSILAMYTSCSRGEGEGPVTPANPADADGDGYAIEDGDCDDADPLVYPGADEGTDEDGDGYAGTGDGIDNDCDGKVDELSLIHI